MQVRINKYISESGFCSRREADKYIEQGCVTVDGKVVEMGSQVSSGQVVKILGETITGKAESIIIAYNKPVGVVSTTDPGERDNVVNSIGHSERIFPIGRLDKDSQGLLLLTNDGDIVNKILRVNNNHDKEYLVAVDKAITPDFIKRMQGGIPILGVVTRKCEIIQKSPHSFTIVLRQGLNRQIRRMCEYLGYSVTKLQRIRIMHIHLNDLKVGQYRNLTTEESDVLYKKIASSVKTEEASTGKSKSTGKSQPAKTPSTAKNKTPQAAKHEVTKAQPRNAKSKRTSDGRPASGHSSHSKPAGRNTAYKPKGKVQKRSR